MVCWQITPFNIDKNIKQNLIFQSLILSLKWQSNQHREIQKNMFDLKVKTSQYSHFGIIKAFYFEENIFYDNYTK